MASKEKGSKPRVFFDKATPQSVVDAACAPILRDRARKDGCSCRGARAGRPHDRADCEVLLSVQLEAQQVEAQIAEGYELRRRGQQG